MFSRQMTLKRVLRKARAGGDDAGVASASLECLADRNQVRP